MLELTCLDLKGNPITHFTQWDADREIIIIGDFTSAPMVHFCNKNSKYALCVNSALIDSNQIRATVPNSLLREPYPLLIYVYATGDDGKQTILSGKIPVKERAEPEGAIYEENTHVVYLAELEQQVLELNSLITSAEEERVKNEEQRIEAENTRQSNETTRQENEASRTNAETKRESDFGSLQQDMQDAIDDCEAKTASSVSKCDTAATNCNNAATAANTATSNANTAAQSANNAADAANNAVTQINVFLENTDDMTVTFTEATTRENIISGESLKILFGKIKKWFTDIEAFCTPDVTQSDIDNIVV